MVQVESNQAQLETRMLLFGPHWPHLVWPKKVALSSRPSLLLHLVQPHVAPGKQQLPLVPLAAPQIPCPASPAPFPTALLCLWNLLASVAPHTQHDQSLPLLSHWSSIPPPLYTTPSPPTYQATDSLVSFPFFEYIECSLVSGALHVLFPLPEILFISLRVSPCLLEVKVEMLSEELWEDA